MNGKSFVMATLLAAVTLTVAFIPVSSQQSPYDPWLDVNEDGKIDIIDLATMAKSYGALGDPTKNVTVTNFPLDENGNLMVNNMAPSIKEMPLSKIYFFKTSDANWQTVVNATPPTGRVWYVSEIRFCIKGWAANSDNAAIRLITKGTIQFEIVSLSGGAFVNDWYDFEFPAVVRFSDAESIVVQATAYSPSVPTVGVLCVIGWEE